MVPNPHLLSARYACELTEKAMILLLGAIAAWAEADPVARP